MTDLDLQRLDHLVNVDGIDQLTASQMIWAPELLVPASDAPTADHVTWARLRGRQIVRDGLHRALPWLCVP